MTGSPHTRMLALLAGLALLLLPGVAAALPVGNLWISEVMYNPVGADDDREWVELYNAGATPIDLSNYTLAWGTTGYTNTLALTGTILPGQYFLVGGTQSDAGNGNPVFQPTDQVVNLAPNLPNPFLFSAGVALFDNSQPNPVHAVIYGGIFGNIFGLVDETGNPGAVNAPAAPAGSSLEFDGTNFAAQPVPTPGSGPFAVPESGPVLLMMMGLVGIAAKGTPRRRRG